MSRSPSCWVEHLEAQRTVWSECVRSDGWVGCRFVDLLYHNRRSSLSVMKGVWSIPKLGFVVDLGAFSERDFVMELIGLWATTKYHLRHSSFLGGRT